MWQTFSQWIIFYFAWKCWRNEVYANVIVTVKYSNFNITKYNIDIVRGCICVSDMKKSDKYAFINGVDFKKPICNKKDILFVCFFFCHTLNKQQAILMTVLSWKFVLKLLLLLPNEIVSFCLAVEYYGASESHLWKIVEII